MPTTLKDETRDYTFANNPNLAMAHHYAFMMKVAAKQELERPSLRHKLKGENRPSRAKPRIVAQQCVDSAKLRITQLCTTQAEAWTSQLRKLKHGFCNSA